MSKISIIVPVYNVESYLARCINSILAQTFQDFDLILVDDGSPDRSGHICDEYAAHESRIHVIHQKNGGLSVARNTGIEWAFEKSNSRWISFIDSDDWIHPKYLEVLYSAVIRDHTKVAIGGALWTDGEVLPDRTRQICGFPRAPVCHLAPERSARDRARLCRHGLGFLPGYAGGCGPSE